MSTEPRRTCNNQAEDELQKIYYELESYCAELDQEVGKTSSEMNCINKELDKLLYTPSLKRKVFSQNASFELQQNKLPQERDDDEEEEYEDLSTYGRSSATCDRGGNVIFSNRNGDNESSDGQFGDSQKRARSAPLAEVEDDNWTGFVPNPFSKEKPVSEDTITQLFKSLDVATDFQFEQFDKEDAKNTFPRKNSKRANNPRNSFHMCLMQECEQRSHSAPVTPTKSREYDDRQYLRSRYHGKQVYHTNPEESDMCYPEYTTNASNESALKILKSSKGSGMAAGWQNRQTEPTVTPLTRLKLYNMKRTQNIKEDQHGDTGDVDTCRKHWDENPNLRIDKDAEDNWMSTPLFHPFWYECMYLIHQRRDQVNHAAGGTQTSLNYEPHSIGNTGSLAVDSKTVNYYCESRNMISIYKFFW